MQDIKVFDDLHMFSSYIGFIDLSFNQYLLLGAEPLLVHAGTRDQTIEILPQLVKILGSNKLQYIFISHFESDECGGLSLIKEYFPDSKAICSQVTARQLQGFGLASDSIVKMPGDLIETADYKLRFVSYPSEMHLWDGLIAFEERRGLLFSSDLFISRGKSTDAFIDTTLDAEVRRISPEQIPNPADHNAVQQNIRYLPLKFILPGHGTCLRL